MCRKGSIDVCGDGGGSVGVAASIRKEAGGHVLVGNVVINSLRKGRRAL